MVKKSSHIFSIVSRCNTHQDSDDAIRCVENIIQHHPGSDVVLVDSNSPIKAHFDKIKALGCYVEDIQNNNYETGAMWDIYYTKKYNRDVYIFLQDSMTVTGNLTPYFNSDVSIIDYCMGWEYCRDYHMDWAKEQLEYTDYSYMDDGFPIVQYNSLIVKRSVLDKLHSKRLPNIMPLQKYESECMERVLGLCLFQEGYLQDPAAVKISPELIKKTWKHRQ